MQHGSTFPETTGPEVGDHRGKTTGTKTEVVTAATIALGVEQTRIPRNLEAGQPVVGGLNAPLALVVAGTSVILIVTLW